MRYKDFVLENTEKHAVLAFGRLSPPTTGHEVLVNKVKEVAKSTGGSHHVVLSHTQDSSKNPLSPAQKLKHAKRFFPKTNLSVSDKESPTFLQHAAKLHKAGATHLHMIAGSDRVPEYKKKLAQYNGTHKGALYNFKKITVHSAGERDPDAEGTSGMSASKMRAHAASGKFKEFKKGIPAHVSDDHAKELYNDVRKGMQIKEGVLGAMAGGIVGGAVTKSIKGVSVGSKLGSALQNQFSKNKKKSTDVNEEFKSLLFEGVHDKSIFKAVFLAGGPGSGKDYVMDNTLKGHGLVEINSDNLFEILMKRQGLDMTMPQSEQEIRDMIRGKAKTTTDLKQALAILGRNGVIVNGTGDNIEKTRKIKEKLEEIGYDTSMVLVNTDDEISKKRNIERGMRGGRTIPENIRKEKWSAVQESRPEYAKLFGKNYVEFDNSEDLKNAPPEVVKSKKDEMMEIWKGMSKFTSGEPTAESAKMWISMEMDKKDKLPIPKDGVVKVAHPDAGHEEEANKLGLQYYGFGRYGKDGHVTHRSVNGNLVEIPKVIAKSPKIPSQGTSMSKNVNEEFEELLGEKKTSLLRDVNGKLRVFHIRRSASTTAHQKNGEVMVHAKGFVVKLNKENDNARENIEFFQETGTTTGSENRTGADSYTSRNSTTSSESVLRKEAGDEQVQQKKLTLQEIRARQKEKFSGDTEQIVELSNEKLAAYKTAASASATAADKAGDFKKGNKRFSGIIRATNKQFKNDAKK